jgi:lipase maturation factor 1
VVGETRQTSYAIAGWLFLRLIGVAYLFAFWSLAQQADGLIGHDGILPVREYMAALAAAADSQRIGWDRIRLVPTLFWLGTSDGFLRALCVSGTVLAGLLIAGAMPALLLPLLWAGYLSLAVVCRDFLSYQWDALLLEAGLLALPFASLTRWDWLSRATDPPRIARWLVWWLLFRLMFGSGVVKLASGDPTWWGLTALAVHYETQPIPTPVAWYVARLPLWFHKMSTAMVLAVELIAPWLVVGPRRLRHFAASLLIGLQVLIALTGNYAFFNVIAIALCVTLLDDATLRRLVPALSGPLRGMSSNTASAAEQQGLFSVGRAFARAASLWPTLLAAGLAVVTVPASVVILAGQLGITPPGTTVVAPLMRAIDPLRSVNPYGLFAVMTTTRPEIIVEGSNDGVTWLAYEFADKVGDERRRPPWVAPFQPRLDWQMWFASLSEYDREPWFQRFCVRLLEGSPSVLKLLARDPFAGKAPRFVRSTLYQYRFAGASAHFKSGVWWTREPLAAYSPVLSLRRPASEEQRPTSDGPSDRSAQPSR